jgi:hypothetical protein
MPEQSELERMIDRGPEWLDKYLRQFEEDATLAYSMIGIEAAAIFRAVNESSEVWATIAVRAAHLHALEDDGRHRASALLTAMRLRTRFISRLGSCAGDLLLDKDTILGWFRAEQEFSIETALERARKLKDIVFKQRAPDELVEYRDDLIKLRNMRHRIDRLQDLADCGELPDDPYFTEWLQIRQQLI